jgi:hypothetical protein
MNNLSTLESQFEKQLRTTLLRAARGDGRTMFSLSENRMRSSAYALRSAAQRIMELRASSSDRASSLPLAARYLQACLEWQHVHRAKAGAVPLVARALLRDMKGHAN